MLDELRAKFLPRFLAVAESRMRQVREAMANPSPGRAGEVAVILHTLVGEASMLGLGDVSEAARAGEVAARAWQATQSPDDVAACARSLDTLASALERLAPADSPAARASRPTVEVRTRVLVVDDSEVNADVLGDALEEAGFEVQTAKDARELISRLADRAPGVVLADVHMPDLEVAEVVSRVRSTAGGDAAHVLLVSGMPPGELAALVRRCGADGFVPKEAGPDAVVERVRAAIEGRTS